MIELKGITVAAGARLLLRNIDFVFSSGHCYTICGPNGAGKSTLLKVLTQEITALAGKMFIDGVEIAPSKRFELARMRAVLSQHTEIIFPLPVEEVVMMGRYPHFGVRPTSKDRHICEVSMLQADVSGLRNRNYLTLSGGEKQRVQFARVLAQIGDKDQKGLRVLLLDEPISYLDLKHQFEFMEQVKAITDERTIVIAVLHDLNLAIEYSHEIMLLNRGEIVTSGHPTEVLTADRIREVFEVESQVHTVNGKSKLLFNAPASAASPVWPPCVNG